MTSTKKYQLAPRKIATTALFLAVMFPYIGPIPGIDTQPFAAMIAALIGIYALRINDPIVQSAAFSAIIVTAHSILFSNDATITYIARSFFPIFTALFIYICCKENWLNFNVTNIMLVAGVYISVGLIQKFIDPSFLTGLVSRPTEHINLLIQSGRGLRSLAPEPAQLGHTLTIFNVLVFLIFASRISNISTNTFIFISLILISANIYISSSLYSFAVHGIIVFVILLLYRPTVLAASLAALILYGAFELFGSITGQDSRFFVLLNDARSNPESLFRYGAIYRVFNIPISIISSIQYGIFGFGSSDEKVVVYLNMFGIEFSFLSGGRNLGGLIEFFLQFGILSAAHYILVFLIFIGSMKRLAQGLKKSARVKLYTVYILSLVLLGFQYGSTSNPLLWLLLAVGWCATAVNSRQHFLPYRQASRPGMMP